MLNAGQKLLTHNAMTQFALFPAAGGAGVGTAYGMYDKMTDPYAHDTMKEYAGKGALIGLGLGGLSAASGRGFRDYKIYKQSVYTNSDPGNHYGFGAFGKALAGV